MLSFSKPNQLTMKHLLIISLLLVAPCLSAQIIYEGTHVDPLGNEDNYSIALPSDIGWADDYFIGGTHMYNYMTSRLKRVDILGNILWIMIYCFLMKLDYLSQTELYT
jgi:hypothetical protein